jgi:hypothetical protein
VSLKVTKTCYSFSFLLNMSGHENGNLKIVIKYVCVGKKKSGKIKIACVCIIKKNH